MYSENYDSHCKTTGAEQINKTKSCLKNNNIMYFLCEQNSITIILITETMSLTRIIEACQVDGFEIDSQWHIFYSKSLLYVFSINNTCL